LQDLWSAKAKSWQRDANGKRQLNAFNLLSCFGRVSQWWKRFKVPRVSTNKFGIRETKDTRNLLAAGFTYQLNLKRQISTMIAMFSFKEKYSQHYAQIHYRYSLITVYING
jgi:hypothetical protein